MTGTSDVDRDTIRLSWQPLLGDARRPEDSIRKGSLATTAAEPGSTPRFVVGERVGDGGMGVVHAATQTSLQRRVALKYLNAELTHNVPVRKNFLSEARLTARLEHPNIVPVHDLADDTDGPYYAMKLIGGVPWSTRLAERGEAGAGDTRRNLEILLSVARAIAFAHERRVLNRDIKPSNVMLGEHGEVTVVDWGLAVSLDPAASSDVLTIDQAEVCCGTPVYMAPEVALGRRGAVGCGTDVYMLGAILLEVVHGAPPHAGDGDVLEAITRAGRNEWVFPERIDAETSVAHRLTRPVIERALAAAPEERYAHAGEFVAALEDLLRHFESVTMSTMAAGALVDARRHAGRGERAATYADYSRAIAGYEQALAAWPRNPEAASGLVLARARFAATAMESGELELAASQGEALREWKGASAPEAQRQAELVELGIGRARARLDSEARRTRLVRRSAVAAVLLLLAGGWAASIWVGSEREQAASERDRLSELLVLRAGEGLVARLQVGIRSARAGLPLLATSARIAASPWEFWDEGALFHKASTLVRDAGAVSFLIADDAGHSGSITRTAEGWRTVRINPAGEVIVHRRTDDGAIDGSAVDEKTPGPRSGGWYREARAADGAVVWSLGEGRGELVGSAAMSGTAAAIALTLQLESATGLDAPLSSARHCHVFVLTEDLRVVAAAGGEGRQGLPVPVRDAGNATWSACLAGWERVERRSGVVFRFESDDQEWWAALHRLELSPRFSLWIAVYAPVDDFVD